MKYVRTAEIPLAEIEVPERLREVDQPWAQQIAEAMHLQGQKTPIELVEQVRGKKYRLVAGGHRFAAAQILGWETLRAEVKAPDNSKGKGRDLELALHEIDENLQRRELSPLDRAVFIGRRQEIYEALHPETKAGVAGGRARQGSANDSVSFATETSAKIGLSERTIQRASRIYKAVQELPPDIRRRLAGTVTAQSAGELYRLTRESPETRVKIIRAILSAEAKTVAFAAARVTGEVPDETPAHELQAKKLRDAWDRASNRARRQHLEFLKKIGVITDFTVEHL